MASAYTGEQPKARTRRVIYEHISLAMRAPGCFPTPPRSNARVRDKHFCISRGKRKGSDAAPISMAGRRTMRAFVGYSTNATVSHLHRMTNFGAGGGLHCPRAELKEKLFLRDQFNFCRLLNLARSGRNGARADTEAPTRVKRMGYNSKGTGGRKKPFAQHREKSRNWLHIRDRPF